MISSKSTLTQYLLNNKEANGFTLIELLVVVIMIGILSAIGLPNLLKQVTKARTSEARNSLGVLNRAQQVYHFQKAVFADSLETLSEEVRVGQFNGSNYETYLYQYAVDGTPTANEVQMIANPIQYTNEMNKVASAVFRVGLNYAFVVCEGDSPFVIPQIIDADTCNNGTILR